MRWMLLLALTLVACDEGPTEPKQAKPCGPETAHTVRTMPLAPNDTVYVIRIYYCGGAVPAVLANGDMNVGR